MNDGNQELLRCEHFSDGSALLSIGNGWVIIERRVPYMVLLSGETSPSTTAPESEI